MSRASVLAAGRRAAEAGMVDTCTITRVAGQTTNDITGQVTDNRITVYTGRCRLQQRTALGTPAGKFDDVGEAHLVTVPFILHIPVSVTGLAEGDDVVMNTGVHDADLPGRQFRIKSIVHASHITARRLGVIEVTS